MTKEDSPQLENDPIRVACTNCAALCCRKGVIMELRPEEAEFMRQSGTALAEFGAKPVGRGRLLRVLGQRRPATAPYQLESDCGNLVSGPNGALLCGVYTDPDRPDICDKFQEGGYGCRVARVKGGIDPQGKLDAWLERSQS